MNELQKRFIEYLAQCQERCVEVCLIQNQCYEDEKIRQMLYDTTYEFAVGIMELIDGYSSFSKDKHDIVNTVTGERIKENPFIELHDVLDGYLKY